MPTYLHTYTHTYIYLEMDSLMVCMAGCYVTILVNDKASCTFDAVSFSRLAINSSLLNFTDDTETSPSIPVCIYVCMYVCMCV